MLTARYRPSFGTKSSRYRTVFQEGLRLRKWHFFHRPTSIGLGCGGSVAESRMRFVTQPRYAGSAEPSPISASQKSPARAVWVTRTSPRSLEYERPDLEVSLEKCKIRLAR